MTEESPLLDKPVGTDINNIAKIDELASSHYRQCKYLEAEELLAQAFEIRLSTQSLSHPSTLLTLNNLAATRARLGKFAQAEEDFRTVEIERTKIFGSEHCETLTTVNHLGVLLKQQGRLLEAEVLLSRALAGFAKALGPDHLCTAETAYNYGVVCVLMGQRNEAQDLFKQAHKGLQAALGPDHQHAMDALHWELKCTKKQEIGSSFSPSETSSQAIASQSSTTTATAALINTQQDWKSSTSCDVCATSYSLMKRQHHCRVCGRSVCHECSVYKTFVFEFSPTVAVRCCCVCEQQGF